MSGGRLRGHEDPESRSGEKFKVERVKNEKDKEKGQSLKEKGKKELARLEQSNQSQGRTKARVVHGLTQQRWGRREKKRERERESK